MPERDLRYWCWWHSRYLWYAGFKYRGKYVFRDVCDVQIEISEEEFEKLEAR